MTPKRTIGDTLDNYHKRFHGLLTASKITEPSVRSLYVKRQRWAAEQVLEGCGYGRLPEWQTPEYLDAVEDFDRAKSEHRKLIIGMWRDRWIERNSKRAA